MATRVSNVRCWPNSNSDKVLGRGDFVLFDTVKISYTLWNGPKGPWCGLPGHSASKPDPETGKKKWYYDVWVDDDGLKKEIDEAVLAKYQEETGGATSQGSASGPTDQTRTPVPF